MPHAKQSKGTCAYCGAELAKGGITRHLPACAKRIQAISATERKPGESEALYHLRVQSADLSDFWLDLEMRGSSTLNTLDSYLRAIWLECCGHMSQFSIGGWGGREIAKRRKIQEIFDPGVQLTHIYDFGTESVTLIKYVAVRHGKPTTPKPIALLARNLMPEATCIQCGKAAAWLCMECLIEQDIWGTLCSEHVEDHPHDDYGEPVPLVNSPRLGMCGYEGPAEPPY